ncbi:IS21 family transposase [Candidatus Sumerlaeota bacterium]|nr:IS21 family transposase [Candidatus Sumerlaeota bacterium]
MNEVRELIYRLQRGEGVREVARAMRLSRNTVRKYRAVALEHGWLSADGGMPEPTAQEEPAGQGGATDGVQPLPDNRALGAVLGPPPRPRHMRSTVEPFAEVVDELWQGGVEMAAIWQRLRAEHGYTGSYSSVRRYVGRVHRKRPEAFCRIETAPGEEAQVDFGSAGALWDGRTGRQRKAWAFVMTLGWSRHQYVEFVFDQKIETWLRCHEHAFAWFGGAPRKVVVDNLKSAVLKAHLHDPVLGEPYRRLAQHYGFVISPNRPRTPRHKGKVESGVKYVKRNFLAGQRFADAEAANHRVRRWVVDVAGVRRHGTTHEAPLQRFEAQERRSLIPLPATCFDLVATYRAKVHSDCHVVVDGRFYSVPYRWIGQVVEVYVGQRVLEIFHGTDLIATHPVAEKPGQRTTRTEHYPEGKRAYLENGPEACRERAQVIGAGCAQVIEHLLGDRVQDRLRSVQALLRMAKSVGRERLEAACQRAWHYGDPSYRRIKAILSAGLDRVATEEKPATVSDVPRPVYQYAREVSAFFPPEVTPDSGEESEREITRVEALCRNQEADRVGSVPTSSVPPLTSAFADIRLSLDFGDPPEADSRAVETQEVATC